MNDDAPLELFGVRLVGVTAESGRKLLLSLTLIAIAILLRYLVRRGISAAFRGERAHRVRFWSRQVVNLATAFAVLVALISLWFDQPSRLATALGLVTAGLAFALQRVVTAVAGYFVILQGKTFGVGDRIVMGGVRGDVISLDFTQTTILEMGQPPPVQKDEPAMWVQSRQYTGRIVTVSNARVFDEPVYNYTREFPYIWEEISIPISYDADRDRVERLLLEVAARHTQDMRSMSEDDRAELARRYLVASMDTAPRVFFRLTDNWLELAVRFLGREHGIRDLKDAMSRDILRGLEEAKIQVASATFAIVGVPPITVELAAQRAAVRR